MCGALVQAGHVALIWGVREYQPTNQPRNKQISGLSVRKKITQVLGQEQPTLHKGVRESLSEEAIMEQKPEG